MGGRCDAACSYCELMEAREGSVSPADSCIITAVESGIKVERAKLNGDGLEWACC